MSNDSDPNANGSIEPPRALSIAGVVGFTLWRVRTTQVRSKFRLLEEFVTLSCKANAIQSTTMTISKYEHITVAIDALRSDALERNLRRTVRAAVGSGVGEMACVVEVCGPICALFASIS